MSEKANLLNQLRIDRAGVPENASSLKWWLAGGTALVAISLGSWWAIAATSGVPVRAAVAQKIDASEASAGGGGVSLLDASGYVVARRQATVSSKVAGKVVEVLLEEGQQVEKDQVIARLDDSNARAMWAQAQAQVKQADANLMAAKVAYVNAQPQYERSQKLLKTGWVSGTNFDASKASYDSARTSLLVNEQSLAVAQAALAVAQRIKDDMTIRAPFSGVVTVKAAQPGEMVSPNSAGGGFTRTGIGTIVDMDSLEVEVDVSESFISRVHSSQPATIKLNAYPDWQIPGEVIAVIPTADRAKATVKVRVAFKEKDARVVPEMGARVSFFGETKSDSPTPVAGGVKVPAQAVQANGETGVLYVIRGDKVERLTVRLGGRNADEQTVLSGIKAGDRVAIGDLTQLSDKAKVDIE